MIVINKPNYTVRMLKDGTIKETYRHTKHDYMINVIVGTGAVLMVLFTLYQLGGALAMLAK